MSDSSWNTYTPPKPSSRLWVWLGGCGTVLVSMVLVILALVGWEKQMRTQAWPLARTLVARLATEEGALDLYRKNPALRDTYATEDLFLETVRRYRPGLQLPEQEPPQSRRTLSSRAGPHDLQVFVRGEGGSWMEFIVLRGSSLGMNPQGEGLARLVFADSLKGLDRSRYSRWRKPQTPKS